MGPVETAAPAAIPQPPEGDNTLALLREGYNFVSRRCERLGSDAFTTTLLGRPLGRLLELDYSVPRQDLRIPMNRFPTGPRSGLILGRARPPAAARA